MFSSYKMLINPSFPDFRSYSGFGFGFGLGRGGNRSTGGSDDCDVGREFCV